MRGAEKEDRFDQFSRTARKLAYQKFSPLQAEILVQLMDGNRTMAELTLSIFHSDYRQDSFQTYRNRVRRAVRNLEKRGLVSKKRILGRDKPYGLTHHGVAKVASIVPDMPEPMIFGRKDLVLLVLTILAGFAAWLMPYPHGTSVFALLLGMTAVRSLQILWRVV